MQDLLFATQSRRAIAAWQAIFDKRAAHAKTPPITLVYVAYADQGREVSGKAFDFSRETVAARWDTGRRDMAEALALNGSSHRSGLTVFAKPGADGGFEQVRWTLCPQR